MKVNGRHYRSIWYDSETAEVYIIDQRWLPHEFKVVTLKTQHDFATAISDMWVRGAPLIGATAAYAIAMRMREDSSDVSLQEGWKYLHDTRPTAINLKWALTRCCNTLKSISRADRVDVALQLAEDIADEDVETNRQIGLHGLSLIQHIADQKNSGDPVNILTHCNAGWLATVDFGTATSPMFHAADAGIELQIWVDETRPRNQGALTAWELKNQGIPHHYITDNAGGHLMQRGEVDLVVVGSDRTAANGDVCNKIGTYLKALAAADNHVPFYVALPSSTIDWDALDGIRDIPIEERASQEITHVQGKDQHHSLQSVQIPPDGSEVGNPAFDVTPARLVAGLITERGVCQAETRALAELFPEQQ